MSNESLKSVVNLNMSNLSKYDLNNKCFRFPECTIEKIFSNLHSNKLNHLSFKSYLDTLDIFKLTTLFKLSSLTKSVILSYFFINKKINYKILYKLTNLEYNYQQKRWGVVDEQLSMNEDFIKIIKNISFFFKNIS